MKAFWERSKRWPVVGQIAMAVLVIFIVQLAFTLALGLPEDGEAERPVAEATTSTAPPPPTTVAEVTTTLPPTTIATTAAPPPPAGLAPLTVAEPTHQDTYERDLFGGGWIDADDNCINTRHEVLITESVTSATVDDCKVIAGEWHDPWSGTVSHGPSEVGIDHTVALANAWRSGAWAWAGPQRLAFANDLTDPEALIALPEAENNSKGDSGPEGWRPPEQSTWCRYAEVWSRIKARWNLTASPQEWAALVEMAATC